MGFIGFVGRVFFSAIFILSAWQRMNDFGTDGGEILKMLEPRVDQFRTHVTNYLKVDLPNVEVKYLLVASIVLEGFGGILFTLGSHLGATLLMLFLAIETPIIHDFYNHKANSPEFEQEFIQFLKNLSMFGALLFYSGMKSSTAKLAARKRKGIIKSKSI